jgi:hypothetical protein
MLRQFFTRTPFKLSIARQESEAARDGDKLDYLPFGVKTLKVLAEGDYRGKVRVSPQRHSAVDGETLAHEDGDGSPQFVVSWGGGHEEHYELDYPKKRIVHFLVRHVGDAVDDLPLTIVARPEDSDEPLDALTVELTYPTFRGERWLVGDLVKPGWQEASPGLLGASDIFLEGQYAPDYISRWWPGNRVTYDAYGPAPPRLRLHYRRQVTDHDDSGDLAVWAQSPGGDEVELATIQGSIPYPLYDMQQVVPELYRFGPQTWALRVWFFWLDKEISLQDLKGYGTRSEEEVEQAWQGVVPKAEGGLAEKGWAERHEIPDAERVDIVFNHDLQTLFAATDLHWREMWGRFEKPDEPLPIRIMNTKPAKLLTEWRELKKAAEGWGNILLSKVLPRNQMSPPHNPQLEVVRELAGAGKLAADPLALESHTPALYNVAMAVRFTSTDVTDG